MTPLQLFLLSIVLFIFFGILSDIFKGYDKVQNFCYTIVGLSIFLLVGSIIWGIFHYIKI